jgi:starch phosphorylase
MKMNNLAGSSLPRRIDRLDELAHNMWWSWHGEARNLFKVLDRFLWKSTGHNPVKLLQRIEPFKLIASAENPLFLNKYDALMRDFDTDIKSNSTWFNREYPQMKNNLIAYFSPEFAIHNSIPMYAGGLGVLAGDYCKQVSDLGIPMVGIGFMYPQGYFRQRISSDGWQEEIYEQINFNEAPISLVVDQQGKTVTIDVQLDSRKIRVAIWKLQVGRVKLYLLDTNVEPNSPTDCQLSACLYAGDREMRLKQEIVLGVGGVRVLRELGIAPTVWHANEGHVTFMTWERIREFVEKGMEFSDALKLVRATTVFTTHTPVPAGNDTFVLDLMQKYFHLYWETPGLSRERFLELGMNGSDKSVFNMTVLGLRTADYSNGVSKLHGVVCRQMWHSLWPDIEEKDVPIGSVTNGIHVPTWIAPQMSRLYDKYLGDDWLQKHDDPALWQGVLDIPDEELWMARRWLKDKLINCMQNRARRRWCEDRVKSVQALALGGLFDAEVLTLGFCRRFTEYKRAVLILSDIERLKRMLHSELQPIQLVFAGKAHPNDDLGKHLIREVYNLATDPQFGCRIAFVEDYDMHISRYLVQGVDVWLNTPRILQEASGTSGMKAAVNGVPHLSILDGWWYEGYNGANGWAIYDNTLSANSGDDDKSDAGKLYSLLEEQIVPLYYDRDINGIPHGWLKIVKETIRSNAPLFSAQRMVKEYMEQMYLPAIESKTPENGDLDSIYNEKVRF